jgi:hypothetical protein
MIAVSLLDYVFTRDTKKDSARHRHSRDNATLIVERIKRAGAMVLARGLLAGLCGGVTAIKAGVALRIVCAPLLSPRARAGEQEHRDRCAEAQNLSHGGPRRLRRLYSANTSAVP